MASAWLCPQGDGQRMVRSGRCPARSVGKEDQVSARSGSTRSPAKSSLSQEVPLTSTCRVHIPIYSTARQFSSAGQQPARSLSMWPWEPTSPWGTELKGHAEPQASSHSDQCP